MTKISKLIWFAVLACLPAFAQISDTTGQALLTSTCTNLNTTCDTAGVTNFNAGHDAFNVIGPQTIEATTQGYGLAQVSASGTYSGSTLNFEFSDDGGNTWYTNTCTRTDTNVQETSEAIATNAYRAWDCATGAATKFRVRQSAIGSGGPLVKITLTAGLEEPAPTIQMSLSGSSGSNPCANPHTSLISAVVAMSSTSATQFIALSGTTKVYICSLVFANSTATNPVQIEYGTGSNCATSPTVFLDKFTLPASTAAPLELTGPVFVTPAGQAVCYIQFGTTPTATMTVNYIQQ